MTGPSRSVAGKPRNGRKNRSP